MKNLMLSCCLFISLSSKSQDKAKPDSTYKTTNPNGSYALVEKGVIKQHPPQSFHMLITVKLPQSQIQTVRSR